MEPHPNGWQNEFICTKGIAHLVNDPFKSSSSKLSFRIEAYPDGWQGEMGSFRVQPVDLAGKKGSKF